MRRILLTGATGYIGGRLLKALENRGEWVRCLVRQPERLAGRTAPTAEIVAGDLEQAQTLGDSFREIDTAYYLVHSLGMAHDFESSESASATHFAEACRVAGVRRIVYLGGLSNPLEASISAHLRSRHTVGEILRRSQVGVTEFRASVILGSGSVSFELIRALVERLPVMVTPRWVATATQPIGVDDVIAYLLAALDNTPPLSEHRIYEIGGPDRVSYGDFMRDYARQRGLRRWMIAVPVLTPRLSSLWLGLVTPVYARIGRKLLEGLRVPSVVNDSKALLDFPIRPAGIAQALATALQQEDDDLAETYWAGAISSSGLPLSDGGRRVGNRFVDSRSCLVKASAKDIFIMVQRIGGRRGWYFGNFLWRLRGWVDLLVGGVGLRRGRRHPTELRVGDSLDFWRVEKITPERLLRLRAEMKLPGRAWLEFEVTPQGVDHCLLRQTAIFDPFGLWGLVYWYGIYPLHVLIFGGMLAGLARAAESGPAHRHVP